VVSAACWFGGLDDGGGTVSEHEHGETVQFSEVISRTARLWRLILAITLIGGVLGAAYSFIQQDRYTATASLTVSPITTNPFNSGPVNQQINITTERAILNSPEVARIAADSLDRDVSPDELLAGSEVAAPSGSQILEVTVTAGSPSDAAEFANALAAAYLQFRAEGAADVALGFIDALDRRILTLEGAETLDATDRAELSSLREQRSSLSLVAENPGRIIGEATAPSSPSTPGLLVWTVIGSALGLLLGSTLAFLKDTLDPYTRNASKLRQKTGSRVVEFRGDHDKDAARRTVRLILQRTADGHAATEPRRVVLLDTRDDSNPSLLENLFDALERAALSTRVVTAAYHMLPSLPSPSSTHDADQQPAVLLIDASGAREESWKDLVLEDGAGLLIATHRTTRITEISRITADTRAASVEPPIFLFIDDAADHASRSTTHRRERKHASVTASEVS
jgi:capsular polysaccharide biosynthesis protein